MNLIRRFYEVLRPLSPYRADTDMPSFRLFTRVNDDAAHGVWRIAVMALRAPVAFVTVGLLHLMSSGGLWPLTLFVVCALLIAKVVEMRRDHYQFDPLDWICDAVCWGGAGAYTAAWLVTPAHPDWRVYAVLFVLWIITYPWSTPR